METLERLVVHVEEAVRLASMNDDPHLRLGLLLLDSAAELLLHRECQSRLQWAEREEQLVRRADELQAATGKEMEWAAELRERMVPGRPRPHPIRAQIHQLKLGEITSVSLFHPGRDGLVAV